MKQHLLFLIVIFTTPLMVYTQNVGVSEDGSAPNQLLHIHENGSTGKGVKITNSTTGNGSSDGVDLINNGSDFEINQLENAAIRLSTNGTERLTLLGNGNIGFGIVNPDEYLTLNGDLKIRGTNRLHFSNTSDRVYIHGPSTDHLAFGTAGTERIRINASGFVGIGSSSPGNLLDLNTTSTSSGIEFDNRLAISGFSGDNWLRLNQSSNFSNGTYTPTHFRTDGELRQGGTDYGAYNIQTNGEIYANDYIIAMGGLHIGGTSDPGTDNLVVDGNIQGNGSMTHNGGTVYRYENLATYNSGSSSVTGSMKITLPKSWSNTMMNVTIKGYNYNGTTGHWEVKIGGYNYSGSSSWVNTSAEISGRPPFSQVRLAHDGTNCIILLGNTASTWNYPKIQVTNMMAGHSQYNSGWGSGWSIAPITSESGITSINTPALTGSGSTAGGDISGPFSNLQINSGVVGQAEIATGGVASAEVSDNSLTAADLASNSVGADEIATDAVRAAEIQADAVGASEIAAGAVGTSEIANGSIAAADLSSMGASANQVMQYNGSSWSAVNSSGIGNDGYIGNASSHTVGGTLNMSGNTLFVNGDDGITDVTGTYGSVQTAGSGSGGWEGYSINGRYVLMSDDNNAVGLYNDVDNRWIIRHERNSDLRFYDPNSTSEIARFNTSGNLGIGNTNPGYKLDVTGTIHGDVINVNGAYSLPTAAGTTSQYLRGDGTWQTLGWTYSGGQLYPTAWPGTDVGIGTNSPNSLFQLYEDGGGATQFTITNASASAQDAYISFQNGATYEWSVGFDNSDGDEFKISRGVAPGINEALSINSSNVVRINNAYNLPNSAAGSPATQFLRGDGTWASPSGSSDGNGIYDGNGTVANGTAVTLSGSLNFDAGTMYMDGAANEIGVGTTSPDAKFNVGETSGANILLTREDVTTNTNDLLGQIKFGSTDGGVSTVDESVMLRAYASETHGSGDKGGYFTIETKTTNVNGNQAATERLRIADNGAITISDLADGSTRMVVASATGVLTTQPITSEISICEFLLSEAVSNGGQEVAFVVPSNLNGRTLVAGVAKGMTGAGTCTVTVYRNGSSVGSITNVGTTHQTATGWSTAVSTGDLITVGTSATSGTLNGLTVTISAQ